MLKVRDKKIEWEISYSRKKNKMIGVQTHFRSKVLSGSVLIFLNANGII